MLSCSIPSCTFGFHMNYYLDGPISVPRARGTYIILHPESPPTIKIGCGNITSRLKTVETSLSRGGYLAAWFPEMSLERDLHERFGHIRIRGEFFDWKDPLIGFVNERRRELGLDEVNLDRFEPKTWHDESVPYNAEWDSSLREAGLPRGLELEIRRLFRTKQFKNPGRRSLRDIIVHWMQSGYEGDPLTEAAWIRLMGRSRYLEATGQAK